jgi:hypothetical protein
MQFFCKIKYFKVDPVYEGSKYCQIYNNQNNTLIFKNKTKALNSSISNEFNSSTIETKRLRCAALSFNLKNDEDFFIFNESYSIFGEYDNDVNHHYHYANTGKFVPEPNIALISFMLVIGTCVMALLLKKLRRSNFFGSYIRRTLSDVGILISIILAVGVDILIKNKTHIITQVYFKVFSNFNLNFFFIYFKFFTKETRHTRQIGTDKNYKNKLVYKSVWQRFRRDFT